MYVVLLLVGIETWPGLAECNSLFLCPNPLIRQRYRGVGGTDMRSRYKSTRGTVQAVQGTYFRVCTFIRYPTVHDNFSPLSIQIQIPDPTI